MALALCPTTAESDEAAMPFVLEALHCLRVGITLFDSEERLIFANEHYNYLFRGLPPRAKLIGLTFEEIVRLQIEGGDVVPTNGHNDTDAFITHCRVQLFAGDYVPRDIKTSDGRIIEIKARRTPRRGWIALWTDVTRARQNLEYLHGAITLSADAFAFYDRRDRLVLSNQEYANLAGVASPDELFGEAFDSVIGRIAKHSVRPEARQAWFTKRTEVHRDPAGAMTMETMAGTAYLIRDRATGDGGHIVVFADVTEHHRAEKVLAEQTRALADTRQALALTRKQSDEQAGYLADLTRKLDQTTQAADTTKTTLLRTMSHELKTPLNAIIGFSDLLGSLADHAGPEQIREYAGLIHQGGRNLLRLLNQILDLTKISAGRYELRLQKMDIDRALWEATQRYDDRARTKTIDLKAEPCAPDTAVNADETALTTMLNHLVENAVTFTQTGGCVRVKAERTGPTVRITVSDNGPGVDESDLKRILEPFEQGGRSTTDHEAGAGLGLTVVKAFAQLHGGVLSVDSAPGKGFTATIDLPAA